MLERGEFQNIFLKSSVRFAQGLVARNIEIFSIKLRPCVITLPHFNCASWGIVPQTPNLIKGVGLPLTLNDV